MKGEHLTPQSQRVLNAMWDGAKTVLEIHAKTNDPKPSIRRTLYALDNEQVQNPDQMGESPGQDRTWGLNLLDAEVAECQECKSKKVVGYHKISCLECGKITPSGVPPMVQI